MSARDLELFKLSHSLNRNLSYKCCLIWSLSLFRVDCAGVNKRAVPKCATPSCGEQKGSSSVTGVLVLASSWAWSCRSSGASCEGGCRAPVQTLHVRILHQSEADSLLKHVRSFHLPKMIDRLGCVEGNHTQNWSNKHLSLVTVVRFLYFISISCWSEFQILFECVFFNDLWMNYELSRYPKLTRDSHEQKL